MTDEKRRDEDDFVSRIDPESRWESPESRWGNPEFDLPNVPSVRIPSTEPDPKEDEFSADVDPQQMRLFWASVILANVALAGVSLGSMLIYFRNEWLFGGGALVLGIASLARVYTMYREYKTTDWEREKQADEDAGDEAEAPADESTDTDDGERNP